MKIEDPSLLLGNPVPRVGASSYQSVRPQTVSEMKERQSAKIRDIERALASAGFVTLDAKAKALGLHRSTVWTIVRAQHKNTGLSAIIVNHMLAADQLPAVVRALVLQYAQEKAAGLYGHSERQRRRFTARLYR